MRWANFVRGNLDQNMKNFSFDNGREIQEINMPVCVFKLRCQVLCAFGADSRPAVHFVLAARQANPQRLYSLTHRPQRETFGPNFSIAMRHPSPAESMYMQKEGQSLKRLLQNFTVSTLSISLTKRDREE